MCVWTSPILQVFKEFGVDPTSSGVTDAGEPVCWYLSNGNTSTWIFLSWRTTKDVLRNAMTWYYQNKANQALPLKSEGSFDVKWKNVKSPKDASLQVIFINHPIVL